MRYDKNINFQSFTQEKICSCGSKEFRRAGFRHTVSGVFNAFKCADCGKHHTGKENLIHIETRKEFLK
jgi:transposase-like protein